MVTAVSQHLGGLPGRAGSLGVSENLGVAIGFTRILPRGECGLIQRGKLLPSFRGAVALSRPRCRRGVTRRGEPTRGLKSARCSREVRGSGLRADVAKNGLGRVRILDHGNQFIEGDALIRVRGKCPAKCCGNHG